jgi:predicted outer membrane protein
MKYVQLILAIALMVSVSFSATGQNPPPGMDTSRREGNLKITDTGFLNNGIRQQILDIKLAQLAIDRSNSPRLKQEARRIVTDGRENLQRLLTLTKGKPLQGVNQAEVDAAMGKLDDKKISRSDPRAAATSGNTVTDSLGSGSTGSGNVSGTDTGTLARTSGEQRNASYSAEGDYAYNNNLFMNEAELLDKATDRDFNARWLSLMLRIHKGKMSLYDQAAAQVKDQKLLMAISQAVPKIRMHNSTLYRLSTDRDISDGRLPLRQGQGNSGSTTTESGNNNSGSNNNSSSNNNSGGNNNSGNNNNSGGSQQR